MSNWLIVFLAALAGLIILNVLSTIEKIVTIRCMAEHLAIEEVIKALDDENEEDDDEMEEE